MNKICQLATCGNEFEDNTSNHNKKYCSNKCLYKDRRAIRKTAILNGPPQVQLPEPSHGQAPVQNRPSSVQLDALGTFIKEQLEEKITDLRGQVVKKDTQIETLQSQLKEKEKEVDELSKNLDAKPTGLAGFAERNADMLGKIAEGMGPKFGEGIGEVFHAIAKKMNAPSAHTMELDKWMNTLSEQQRTEVLIMLQNMINLGPQKMMEKVTEFTRGLMGIADEETKFLPAKKQVGLGL